MISNLNFSKFITVIAIVFNVFQNLLIAQNTTETFDTPGTYNWVVPACVTQVTVQVWGGGGGGGAVWSRFNPPSGTCGTCGCETGDEICAGAGGGGGGGFASRTYTVVPGNSYTIVVGAGGAGGTASAIVNGANPGSTGGFSRFSGPATITPGALTANGGNGGGAGNIERSCSFGCGFNHNGVDGAGGAGGTGINGTSNFTGGLGSTGSHSSSSNDRSGGGGGAAGPSGAGGNATGVTTGGIGNAPGGNGANGRSQNPCSASMCGQDGNLGSIIGGGGGGAVSHNRNSCNASGSNHQTRIGGAGGRGEVRLTYPTPGADLLSNGTRIAPTGPQCSGTALNFQSIPTGGNGSYVYSWSTVPATITSTSNTFSPTLVNNGCSDIIYTINLSVTSCGVTRDQQFFPTIRPIPTISLGATVSCTAATVLPNGAQLCGAPCPTCSYVLQSCAGCVPPSPALGTENPSGSSFALWGASSAGFSATLNGCSSATQSLNFLAAPFNCATPLSAELNQFNVVCGSNNIELNWIIDSQKDNDHFTIERSTDGLNFELMKKVSGSGTTNTSESYYLSDERPIIGMSYYRLSQVDYDGVKTDLGTLSSEWPCKDPSNSIEIFPNPTDGDVNLVITNDDREHYSVEIFDAIGQLVIPVIDEKIEQQGTTLLKVKTSELSAGIFLIKVVVGERVYTEKLIIKK